MENEKTAFDLIKPPINIKTPRLTISDITENDKKIYAALYKNDGVNEFYGYDYREDLNGEKPTADYFYKFFLSLKDKKEEYSVAVRRGKTFIGEIVFYNFSALSLATAEIGFRFFKKYQGKGYAFESVFAALDLLCRSGIKKVISKCIKQNSRSKKLIEKLGFSLIKEDDVYFYFEKSLL